MTFNERDRKKIKQFISNILEDIFDSPAKGLEDLENIKKNFKLFLVAKQSLEIVGTISIKEENGNARISRMYVKKEMRGKGIGKELMSKILDYCKGKYNRIFLTTYEQMKSEGFYKKIGFKTVKKEGNVILMKKST